VNIVPLTLGCSSYSSSENTFSGNTYGLGFISFGFAVFNGNPSSDWIPFLCL